MTYKDAQKAIKKIGVSKVEGLPLLAMTIDTLALTHPGINPEMAYNGAVKKGLTAGDVRKMDGVSLGDLMFV